MLFHHGTHVDAPEHQCPGGKQVDDYPINRFLGNALLVDLSNRTTNEYITPGELEEMIGQKLQGIDMLLFKVDETKSKNQRPALDSACFKWCADHGIKMMNGHDVLGHNALVGVAPTA